MELQDVIRALRLQPHMEGGCFRETYRCAETLPADVLPQRYGGCRALSTAIYYLLTPDTFSVMHRLQSDEVYHFYLGDTVEMLLLPPHGQGEVLRFGQNIQDGEHVQFTVPRMWWQGLRLRAGGRYGLLGCTVAPGFDYADFEEGARQPLQKEYPQHADLLAQLTRR